MRLMEANEQSRAKALGCTKKQASSSDVSRRRRCFATDVAIRVGPADCLLAAFLMWMPFKPEAPHTARVQALAGVHA